MAVLFFVENKFKVPLFVTVPPEDASIILPFSAPKRRDRFADSEILTFPLFASLTKVPAVKL